jgi:hypothetical protein
MLMIICGQETCSHEVVNVLAPRIDLSLERRKVDPYRLVSHLRRLLLGVFPGDVLRLRTSAEVCAYDLPMSLPCTNV